MDFYIYKDGISLQDQVNGAYWERNMLALLLAEVCNSWCREMGEELDSGWYYHGEWNGWSRVISIMNGRFTFHVPDDFNLGHLPQIEPNWNGHTTREKWIDVMNCVGIIGKNE